MAFLPQTTCRYLSKDWGNQVVGFLLATWHQGRTLEGTKFPTGNPHADEVDPGLVQLGVAGHGVVEVSVPTIDQNVTLVEQRKEGVDNGVSPLPGLDHHQDPARLFQGVYEVFQGVTWNQLLFAVIAHHFVSPFTVTVVNANGETAAFDVQGKVLTHDSETDHTNLCLLI